MDLYRIMVSSLKSLFVEYFGREPASVVKLCGDGSNRTYYRLAADKVSAIGVIGVSVEENRAFIAIAKAFAECGIASPQVFAVSGDNLSYLQSDLGDETLFASMKSSRESGSFSHNDIDTLCKVMSALPHIQYKVPAYFDFSMSYPYGEFDKRSVMWDLNYFKYCFLKGVGGEFNERMLEDEFERMAALLLQENENTFLYRDFQSRNVMLHNGEPFFIDFQGARKGPIYYDVASFVGQARACYTPDAVEKMIDAYLESLSAYKLVERDEFMNKLQLFRVFRLLQNLGTYGYRGLFERKKAFVEIIPAALAQLKGLLRLPAVGFPYLRTLVGEISSLPLFRREEIKELTVDVVSFSYRRGIPDDTSGNGGGFVFDCRAIHNPGRYEAYKKLNGMDKPVIDFLEKESGIASFLDNAYSMVDNMVETYLERGFTHIQVCCGCTGGQHRSVYSAEHIARHVADRFGVKVAVTHKMLNKHYVIESRR